MNAKQFQNLPHGTKILIPSRSGDDTAQGIIIKCQEYNTRGTLVTFNKIKIIGAAVDSSWAKYVKRGPQAGLFIETITVI